MERAEAVYRRFRETKQERLRLEAALEGFFLEEAGHREEYGAYLKNRIRPAAEKLMADSELEKLQVLEERGFFGERELEGFLKLARELERPAVLLWLMRLKDEKYGYRDRDFSL